MKYKSTPLKSIIHEKKVIKFDKNGFYETTDEGEIKTIAKAVNVKKVK